MHLATATAAISSTLSGVTRADGTGCSGDCNGNAEISIDELLTMVNVALGKVSVLECAAGDANGNGQITVDEIIVAANNAISGCPSVCGDGIVTPPEECDDGNLLDGDGCESDCTLTPGARTMSMPEVSIAGCSQTTAVVSLDNANDIIGFEFAVSYDASFVIARAVALTAVTAAEPSCALAWRVNAPAGTVAIAVACPTARAAAGGIVDITFEGTSTGASTLHLSGCSLNESLIPCNMRDGRVSVSACA